MLFLYQESSEEEASPIDTANGSARLSRRKLSSLDHVTTDDDGDEEVAPSINKESKENTVLPPVVDLTSTFPVHINIERAMRLPQLPDRIR